MEKKPTVSDNKASAPPSSGNVAKKQVAAAMDGSVFVGPPQPQRIVPLFSSSKNNDDDGYNGQRCGKRFRRYSIVDGSALDASGASFCTNAASASSGADAPADGTSFCANASAAGVWRCVYNRLLAGYDA
uniref:Uncharacterized protein n=1 Tax=Romanomermis culicivorax TaxID=13658 RepID=A0A915I4J4_ROMCU